MQVFQIWKTSGLEDFQTTSRRQLLGSFLTESTPISPFHNRSGRFGFNQMVLIFNLDMYFVCSIKTLEDLWKVFSEVFQTTFRKSSNGVFFHIKWSLSLSS
ncbi:hypothetical protein YC2023_065133 [Brassica napus]